MAYPRKDLDMSMGTIPAARGADAKGVNDMLVCTYDESHIVSGGRYFSHIEECRKAYLAKGGDSNKMLKCPYRSSHHVAAHMMDKHIVICEGYYEWHMLNQEDPPSMKVKERGVAAAGKDETASETGEFQTASEMETDSVTGSDDVYSDGCSTIEDEGTTTDAYASAQELLSD